LPKNCPDPQIHRTAASGFTLIEVLVALAIAALGLGFLMLAAGTGLGNSGLADRTIEATRLAQSHLAQAGVTVPLRPGEQSGDDGGGYSWRVRISQPLTHTGAPSATAPQLPLGLYTVEVTVSWRSGAVTKAVSLTSQLLGRLSGDNG
jgi:general secretion pathway protein I